MSGALSILQARLLLPQLPRRKRMYVLRNTNARGRKSPGFSKAFLRGCREAPAGGSMEEVGAVEVARWSAGGIAADGAASSGHWIGVWPTPGIAMSAMV